VATAARRATLGHLDGESMLAASAPLELAAPAAGRPQAAFTVDVEDWYQSCVDVEAPITDRVVANVARILELLDESGVKGTFFVQGRVAETFPRLVEGMVVQGHEVQCHGYSHRPLYGMNRRQLREELERAKQTVEDAAGVHVSAFRAQDFSILAGNLWALSRRSPRSASRSTRRSSRCVRRGTESPTGSLHRIGSGFRTTAPFSSAGCCLAGAEMADSGGGRWATSESYRRPC
jgi:peptidoglycan/xylan/chitin deacetylase (PgdA/CDA1 family)